MSEAQDLETVKKPAEIVVKSEPISSSDETEQEASTSKGSVKMIEPKRARFDEHRVLVEVWIKEKALSRIIPLMAPFGPIQISRPDCEEVAQVRAQEVDMGAEKPTLICSYEQFQAWYGRDGQGASPPQRWLNLTEEERETQSEEHNFMQRYDIPIAVNLENFPTPVVVNARFPQVTAVGEIDIPVEITRQHNTGILVEDMPIRGFMNRPGDQHTSD